MDTELAVDLVGTESTESSSSSSAASSEKKAEGLLTVVECDLPVHDVQKILTEIGIGTVGPASVISSMGRDTNKTIVLMTRDLFDHLEVVNPEKMDSITKVEEYDDSKCIPPNFKKGETFDIFCRLTNTRLTEPRSLTSSFVKNDVICILEYMRDVDLLPVGSFFVDVPTPDRRVGSGGQVDFFFVRLSAPAHGKAAMKLKAFLNGHLLPSSYTVISTFWARGKTNFREKKEDTEEDSRPRRILNRSEKSEGKRTERKTQGKKKMIVTPDVDDDGFRQPRGNGRRR